MTAKLGVKGTVFVWLIFDISDSESGSVNLYIQLAASKQGENAQQRRKRLGISIFLTGFFSALLCGTVFYLLWRKKFKNTGRVETILDLVTAGENELGEDLPLFSFNSASTSFGRSVLDLLYTGKLADGREIAVKRLSMSSGQGFEEFKNEVTLLHAS